MAEGYVTTDIDDPQMELELYHIHLPKLEAADLVEWDRDAETLTRGPDFEPAEHLLKAIEELPEGRTLDPPR